MVKKPKKMKIKPKAKVKAKPKAKVKAKPKPKPKPKKTKTVIHAKERFTLLIGTAPRMPNKDENTWNINTSFKLKQVLKLLSTDVIKPFQVVGLSSQDKYIIRQDVDLTTEPSPVHQCHDCTEDTIRDSQCLSHLQPITNFDEFVRQTIHLSEHHSANTWSTYKPDEAVTYNTIKTKRIELELFGSGHRSELTPIELINSHIKQLMELSDGTRFGLAVLPSHSKLALSVYHKETGEHKFFGLATCGSSRIVDAAGTIKNTFTNLRRHAYPHLFMFTPDLSDQIHVHPCVSETAPPPKQGEPPKTRWLLEFLARPSQDSFNMDHGTFAISKDSDFFQKLFDKLPTQHNQFQIADTITSDKFKLGCLFEYFFMLITGGNEGGFSGGTADIMVNGTSIQVKGKTIDDQCQFQIDLQSRTGVSYSGLDYMAFCTFNSSDSTIRFYQPMPIQSGYIRSRYDANFKSMSTCYYDSEGWPVASWIPKKHFDLKLDDEEFLLKLHCGDLGDIVNEARDSLGLGEIFNQEKPYIPFGTSDVHKQKLYSMILTSLVHDNLQMPNWP